ncbi:hypothetical protein RB653_001425 [Dictyostelium firmibasis]|uniref:Uncharacterized protein n=1 Tax=Dictyostelium firmibasis TaxID=79012 RepID=A0AAN7U448_9MYCE
MSVTSDKIKLPPYIEGTSALLGSTVATAFLQPFDFLKVRLQGSGFASSSGNSSGSGEITKIKRVGVIETCKNVLKNEGIKQFWRGSSPTIVASGIAWGTYMHFYETYKNILKTKQNVTQLDTFNHFICAVGASASQVFITNPIFLIKTRMQLQTPGSPTYYTGIFDGIKKTVKIEGFKGLYKGVIPSLWLTFHGGIQMSSYEHIKYYFSTSSSKSLDSLNASEIFIASSVSKLLASTILYPFQVVKTRLQDERNIPNQNNVKVYNGTKDVIFKILKNEGITGFYRGFVPNTIKVIPNTSITLLVYEEIKKMFQLYYK